jgi:hypothetical protein
LIFFYLFILFYQIFQYNYNAAIFQTSGDNTFKNAMVLVRCQNGTNLTDIYEVGPSVLSAQVKFIVVFGASVFHI